MLFKPKYQIVTAGLCLTIVAILSLMVGSTLVSPGTVIQALFNFDSRDDLYGVVTGTQAPRTVIVLLTDAVLAVSGLPMQTPTRSPIASPGLFGTNAGAVFLVIFSITFIQVQSFEMIVVIAFLGTIVVTVLAIALGTFRQTLFSSHRIILVGATVVMLFTTFTRDILIMSKTDLQGLLSWLSGSVSLRNIWDVPWIIPLVLILILITFSMAARINILMTGDDIATELGQNIKLIKWMIIMLISMLADISAAVTRSTVPVRLIIPNISKRLLPPSYGYLIPLTALTGVILMIISDIVARVIIKPLELPIGVVTAVIGAIVLIYPMKEGRQCL